MTIGRAPASSFPHKPRVLPAPGYSSGCAIWSLSFLPQDAALFCFLSILLLVDMTALHTPQGQNIKIARAVVPLLPTTCQHLHTFNPYSGPFFTAGIIKLIFRWVWGQAAGSGRLEILLKVTQERRKLGPGPT